MAPERRPNRPSSFFPRAMPHALGLGVATIMIAVAIVQGGVRLSAAVSPSPARTLVAAATVEHRPVATASARPTRSAPALPGATSAAGPGATSSPTPDAVSSPSLDIPTPFPSVAVVDAKTCNPALVPSANVDPFPAVTTSARFSLRVPVLMYHRIVPYSQAGDSRRSLVVPPEVFDAQLAAAQAGGWHTITAAQLAADLAAGVRPPTRTFVITIDDGWKDGYTYALPILRAHGFVATFYVIAGRINYGSFLDAWQLRALIAAGNEIGDHTMTHVALADEKGTALTYEIDAAAATIADATGQWPQTLAYPSGSFNLATEKAVQACSTIKMAVIVGQGAFETWAGRFQVPRLRIDGSTRPGELLTMLANPSASLSKSTSAPAPRGGAASSASPVHASAPTIPPGVLRPPF